MKGKVRGSIIGVRVESNRWYVRLAEDCPIGKAGEIVIVSKAVKSNDGTLEVEDD